MRTPHGGEGSANVGDKVRRCGEGHALGVNDVAQDLEADGILAASRSEGPSSM